MEDLNGSFSVFPLTEVHLKWTTRISIWQISPRIPSFQGRHFNLTLSSLDRYGIKLNLHPQDEYRFKLNLQRQNGYGCPTTLPKASVAVVHLEWNVSGRVESVLPQTTHFQNVPCEIWKGSYQEIVSATGRNLNDYVTVVVVLKDNQPQADTKSTFQSTSVRNVPCVDILSEDLYKYLKEASDHSDVEFQTDDDSYIKAHKAIVCARSPVFHRMLHSDMKEAKSGVVKIPDMKPDILKRFVRYIYTGRVNKLTFEVAMSLYEAGDKYQVRGLAKRCSDFLMACLTIENACDVLLVADAHSDSVFVDKVVHYMMKKKVPLKSRRWSRFCLDHPNLAIKVLNGVVKVVLK